MTPILRGFALSALAIIAPATLVAQLRGTISPGARPEVLGTIGPWAVTATVGAGGVSVRVGGRRRAAAPTIRVASVLATADSYQGTRYKYGGTTAEGGFDCSGFVQHVFRKHGVALPRTSRQQALAGDAVAPRLGGLRAGDLLLFASNGSRVDHVAIYAGRGRIIHSSASGGGVRYDDLSSRRGQWFVSKHVASRRVVADGRSLVRELDAVLRAVVPFDPPDRAPPQ